MNYVSFQLSFIQYLQLSPNRDKYMVNLDFILPQRHRHFAGTGQLGKILGIMFSSLINFILFPKDLHSSSHDSSALKLHLFYPCYVHICCPSVVLTLQSSFLYLSAMNYCSSLLTRHPSPIFLPLSSLPSTPST